jgi:hypothetical protein
MGHASMRAALIYQHATSERDREIAAALSERIEARRPPASQPQTEDSTGEDDGDDGAAGVLASVS